MKTIQLNSLLFTASATALLFSAPALAQDAGTIGDPDDQESASVQAGDYRSGPIIVTAQRREESLLEVPLAISASTGEQLDNAGIEDLTSLRFTTPGYTSASGTGYTQVFIRGIGNRIYVGADPSVATFIDDVPRTFGSLVDRLNNVERVEVLKGAQGGLYGRNATGGVVNIITRQPDPDEASMQATLAYGTKDTVEAQVYANLPIADNIAANISASRNIHDSYTPNQATGTPYADYAAENPAYAALSDPADRALLDSFAGSSKVNDLDVYSLDGKIAYSGERMTLTLAGDYAADRDDGGAFSFQRDPDTAYATYAFLMGLYGFGDEILPQSEVYPDRDDKFDSFVGYPSRTHQTDYGTSLKAEMEFDGFDLTAIGAARWNDSSFSGDLGAATVPIAGFLTEFERKNQYLELRAVSNGDGPLSWLGGATYYHEKLDYSIQDFALGFLNPSTTSVTKADAYSIYGQLGYDITDRLNLTGSLRWIWEEKTADYSDGSTASEKVDEFIPSATISYHVGSGGTLYARYARGVKTGGPNPIVSPSLLPGGQANSFGPEKVDTYEIGFKTELFGGQADLTSAIFYNDYRDLQLTKTGATGIPFYFIQAEEARTYGAEVAVNWRTNDYLTVSGSVGYLNAKYEDFSFAGVPAIGVPAFNNDGDRMLYSPKWQASLGVNADVPINEEFHFEGNVLYSYSSSYDLDLDAPLASQDAYSLVNLKAGVRTADDRIGIFFVARNLFDEFYATFGQRDAVGSEQLPGSPRTLLGQIEIKF